MMKYVLLALAALTLSACSSGDAKDEPLTAATPPPVEAVVAEQDVPVVDATAAVPVTVPRVKQAQIVGVLREMRANGCILQKVANTDGIHYSQLVITCGAPQAVPAVE
jgi:hypothetical protein